jgi:MFS transporter, UMF1 family
LNDKREINGWMMYDWANSAFSTTVVTALLGPYIQAHWPNQAANPSVCSALRSSRARSIRRRFPCRSFCRFCFCLLLGTIADHTHLKKRMLLAFAYTGAFATIMLFFVSDGLGAGGAKRRVVFGSLLFIIANLCFGAAIVFYNSFLPQISSP